MRVIVKTPLGARVQGAHVNVQIAGLVTLAYNKTVTTNDRGEATFPNPGILTSGDTAHIEVKTAIDGLKYEYHGAVGIAFPGTFPKEHEAILSSAQYTVDGGKALGGIVVLGAMIGAVLVAVGISKSYLLQRRGYLA
jgi:hypothetical protein